MENILLIVDGHSLAFRAFYGLSAENFVTSSGQYTNAVYGFTSMFTSLIKKYTPTHVAVAFDLPGPTFRTGEYSEYKAGRRKTPEEFYGQIDLIQEVLISMGIVFITLENYEADDIIATLSSLGRESGYKVLISSGDRDAFQLINEQVTVLYPKRGVSELLEFDGQKIYEKYAVTPAQYPDLAALVGEKADNLPGVPKVGEKTAAKWLGEYGDLDSIIANSEKIKGVVGENLRSHIDDVRRNRRLNRLVVDLDLSLGLGDLKLSIDNFENVVAVFEKLEFSNTLKNRVLDLKNSFEQEILDPVPVTVVEYLTIGKISLRDWLFSLDSLNSNLVSVSLITEIVEGVECVVGVSLYSLNNGAICFLWEELGTEDRDAFVLWAVSESSSKIVYDAKNMYKFLKSVDLPNMRGVVCDVLLSAYLFHPDRKSYSVADLEKEYLDFVFVSDSLKRDVSDVDGGGSLLFQEFAQYAAAVFCLGECLLAALVECNMEQLATVVELPTSAVLADMEYLGIAIDVGVLEDLFEQFKTKSILAQQAAWLEIGEEVNLNSPKQLQVILFDKLSMPKTKKIKTGYSTDADALRDLIERKPHPFLLFLLKYRDAVKMSQTIDGLLKSIGVDSRIHTVYQQTVAGTGRLSSVNPNLQNIPIRSVEGAAIREAFVSGSEYEGLLTADYSQIEMRIMAHLSGDESLREAFVAKEDLHNYVASRIFGIPSSQVTSDVRSKVKAVSYGLVYGLSSFGLSKQLRISVDEARVLMSEYFDRFGAVRDYLRQVVVVARDLGYTETVMGRRRYLPDLNSDVYRLRENAERAALNAPIQGSAADIIKLAMLGVSDRLNGERLKSRLLLQVHDELILEVFSGEREVVEKLVVEEMDSAIALTVPLEVNLGFGKNWRIAAH